MRQPPPLEGFLCHGLVSDLVAMSGSGCSWIYDTIL